jgi:hypothetical protein
MQRHARLRADALMAFGHRPCRAANSGVFGFLSLARRCTMKKNVYWAAKTGVALDFLLPEKRMPVTFRNPVLNAFTNAVWHCSTASQVATTLNEAIINGENANMKSAWVITQEGTRHSTEVIGILSSRKSAKNIKAHLEWFYALLHSTPSEHLNFARYINPEVPYEAEYGTTNTGIPVDYVVRCGHNPYLVACRAKKNASLIDVSGNASVLKWTNPDRLICDEQTPPNIV